jgi:enoyl-CoA hydratase
MDLPNDAVLVESDGPVRILTLNRPATRNAVDADVKACLLPVWDLLADDLDAGAVVLTGAGTAFSAGGDISGFRRVTEDAEYRRRIRLRQARRIIDAMTSFPLPIVAAVNGPAVGLGCSLASLCDVVLMSEKAFMADPHVSLGLVAGDGGAAVWPLMMSLTRAKEYLLTGDRISAAEAYRIGLANHVHAPDELMPRTLELAHRLAAQPRLAVQETKKALNMHIQRAAFGVLDTAITAESESFTTPEHAARIRSFLEKSS